MGRELQCPSCGAAHHLANPGITLFVCSYCHAVLHWGRSQSLQIGQKSILPESDARLFLDAHGVLQGSPYRVLGHVRYDHGSGVWDEWYLQTQDGQAAWLSESERQLTREFPVAPSHPLPPLSQLQPGAELTINGAQYTVREVGQAICVGVEGQLPFVVLPDERYGYADLASLDGQVFATLEYDQQGQPTVYVGSTLGHDQLSVDDSGRPVPVDRPAEGAAIQCTNCGASLEGTVDKSAKSRACRYCGAIMDLTTAERRVLGQNPGEFQPGFQFEVGDAGSFDGARYEVAGRVYYDDVWHCVTCEYLLFNPERGYLWLAEENGHYVLCRPTRVAPARAVRQLSAKASVRIGERSYRFFESGSQTLQYVDGALPWQATVGDDVHYSDLSNPPHMFMVEYGDAEVEYFEGTYMPAAEVWRAFDKKARIPFSRGVHPAQPYQRSAGMRLLMIVGALVGVANLVFAVQSLSSDGEQVFQTTVTAAQYSAEHTTPTFELPQGQIISLETQAATDNSWVAVSVAMLDAKDRVVAEMEGESSYYSGYEDGEHWTEGSRADTRYFRSPPKGQYRFIVKGAGGSGETGPARGEPITLELRSGGVLTRYFGILALLAFLFPALGIASKTWFERRRWAPVMEDDDD